MLSLDWRASFRQRVMSAFTSDPRLFARMLAVHVGVLPPAKMAGLGLSLGWELLHV